MVLSMKIISLAFDLDARTVQHLPGPLEYAGYVFNVSGLSAHALGIHTEIC